jgi:hypothetical protein
MIRIRKIREEDNPAILNKEEEIHDLEGEVIDLKQQLTNPALTKEDKDSINQRVRDIQDRIAKIKDDISYMK